MIVNGHLGNDPEVKTTKSGAAYTTFRIANSEYGDPENSAYWFTVTVWDSGLQNFCKSLKKGSFIIIDGDYSNRIYTSNKTGAAEIGNDLRATSIYFGGGAKRDENESGNNQASASKPAASTPAPQPAAPAPTSDAAPAADDDLPF